MRKRVFVHAFGFPTVGLAALLGQAQANDTASMGTAANVQFIHNDKVVIHRENLEIGPLQDQKVPIRVRYEMENQGEKPEKVQMAFPLPGCSFEQYVDARFYSRVSREETCIKEPEMHLQVDGKALSPGTWTTLLSIRDVPFDQTDESKRAKVRSEDLLAALNIMPEFPDEKKDEVFERRLDKFCLALGGRIESRHECQAFRKIRAQRVFLWNYTFEPKRLTHVEHRYVVESSYNLEAASEFSSDVFCLKDKTVLKAWRKFQESDHPQDAGQYFIGYILKTGSNWAAPIGEFNLVLKKSSPRQFISTCFEGLKKTGPLEFRAQRKKFKPTRDLFVLFFSSG